MTNEEILKGAIEKAVKNGLKGYSIPVKIEYMYLMIQDGDYYHCIFSHEFAKAFWGDKKSLYDKDKKCLHCGVDIGMQPSFKLGCNHAHYPEACLVCSEKTKGWLDYLQEMVKESKPLKYIERFLEKEKK